MIPHRLACFPHAGANAPALAARAGGAIADDAPYANPQTLVERVNAYGRDGDPVARSGGFSSLCHKHSIGALSIGGRRSRCRP